MRIGIAAILLVTNALGWSAAKAQDLSELQRINAIVVACERLEHDYALYRDRDDAQAFANIFTEDGEWGRPATVLKGRDAIREYVESSSGGEAEAHMQLQTTIQITPVDETTATGVSYALVLEAPIPDTGLPASTVGFQVASESRSVYRLTDDGWKIASREYTTLFVDPE